MAEDDFSRENSGYNVQDMRKQARGRPRKFGRPAKAVTLTLPQDVIERLGAMNTDLGRAIVALVERAPRRSGPAAAAARSAEIATFGSRSVILVKPVRALARIRGVHLVPVPDGRALIALDHPHSVAQLELDLHDAMERVAGSDRTVLESVADILRDARLSHHLTVAERSIIVLEERRRR